MEHPLLLLAAKEKHGLPGEGGGRGKGAPARGWPDPHAALRGSLPATYKGQLLRGGRGPRHQAEKHLRPQASGCQAPRHTKDMVTVQVVRALRPGAQQGTCTPQRVPCWGQPPRAPKRHPDLACSLSLLTLEPSWGVLGTAGCELHAWALPGAGSASSRSQETQNAPRRYQLSPRG